MEKLTCTSCGATMTPNTNQPYLTCEYCDSAVENKFYIPSAEPVETVQYTSEATEAVETQSVQETVTEEEPSLLERLTETGKDLLENVLDARNTYHRPSKPVTISRPTFRPVRVSRPSRPTAPSNPAVMPSSPSPVRPSIKPSSHGNSHHRPEHPGGGRRGKGPGGR